MAVLLIKDKKELIVSCSCGCEDSFHLTIDCDDDTDYAFLSYMNGDFYRNKNTSFFRNLRIKLRKILCILFNKDYYYSDVRMFKKEFELFIEVFVQSRKVRYSFLQEFY